MKKKALAMALALVLCLSLLPSGVLAAFSDVPADTWYSDAVSYVNDKGIMIGVSSSEFNPGANMTRAQLCQILYNMEGKPGAGSATFTDVSQSDWFYNAVVWAASKGIVSGVGGNSFAPNNPLSREQTATLLYRYAQYKDYDVSGTVSLDAFSDAGQISSWAMTAMQWAVGERYISGTSGTTLTPGGTATRAQIAVIIMRFCQKAEAYAEFKAKDVEDFEGYEIINFDDSNETNFAVLTEDAVASESSNNRNQLVSSNEDEGIYVFSNIDEKISSLAPGDVFYITYGSGDDDYLLLKVGSIEINGSTATITEGEATLEDYFQYIDVDMDINLSGTDFGLDDSDSSDLHSIDDSAELLAKDITGSASTDFKFKIGGKGLNLTATAKITLTLKISYDKTIFDVTEISIIEKSESSLDGKISSEKESKYREESNSVKLPVTTGVDVELLVYFEATASAKASGSIKGTMTSEQGMKYGGGETTPIEKAEKDISLDIGGDFKLSAGIGLEGKLVIAKVLKLSLSAEGGIELEGTADVIDISTNKNEKHTCITCVDGAMDFYFKVKCKGTLGLRKFSWDMFEFIPVASKIKFGDFYISYQIAGVTDRVEFGWGKCPHKQYLVTAKIVDPGNKPVSTANVVFYSETAGNDVCSTNAQGIATSYCDNGKVSIVVTADGYKPASKDITVRSKPVTVTIKLESDSVTPAPDNQYVRVKRTVVNDSDYEAGDVYDYDFSFDFSNAEPGGFIGGFGTVNGELIPCRGTTVYTYDSNGNMLRETCTGNRLGGSFDYEYVCTYDNKGNMLTKAITVTEGGLPFNRLISCTYDSNNRMLSKIASSSGDFKMIYTYTYDASGRILTEVCNGNPTRSYRYEGNTMICHEYDTDYTYTYDNNGNILSKTYNFTCKDKDQNDQIAERKVVYTYDDHGNLVSARWTSSPYFDWASAAEVTDNFLIRYDHTYDSHGNIARTKVTWDGEDIITVTYEYAPLS